MNPGDRGIATIWDKDILIYMASLVNERIERDLPVERTVAFNVYDLLRTTGRGTGKDGYELFINAIYRLRSTSILTTIEANGKKERTGFGWISDFRVIEKPRPAGR